MDRNRTVFELFERLCRELVGPQNERDAFQVVHRQLAMEPNFMTTTAAAATTIEDESILLANLNATLSKRSPASGNDVRSFANCYEQLSNQLNVNSRKALLLLLYLLSDSAHKSPAPRLPLSAAASAAVNFQSTGSQSSLDNTPSKKTSVAELVRNFSENLAVTSSSSSPSPSTNASSTATTTTDGGFKKGTPTRQPPPSRSTVSLVSATNGIIVNGGATATTVTRALPMDQMDELVQDVIYAFVGAQGKYLRKDIRGFILDPLKAKSLSLNDAQMLLRLAELGHLHDQILEFTNADSGKQPLGLFGQGLVTAIRTELTQYYGMVACLQEQVNRGKEEAAASAEKMTLVKMMLWVIQPLHRFQCIYSIATACQDKRGGALASAIFSFLHNGDPKVKALTKELLRSVCVPLVHMLSRWLLDGAIEDPHGEFFIESLPEVHSDRLWHDKYRVRKSLLPSFMSLEMAQRILLIGKSINFLREVCNDKSQIRDRAELALCLSANTDDLFVPFEDTRLHAQIERFCVNTSHKVLELVVVQSDLMRHLHAIRKYLLLGQGDFIGALMENLKRELDRPAKEIQGYSLSAILEATVRTSAYASADDEQCLNNLTVVLLNSFEGDSGWDLFTLQYKVDGPLVTMLEPAMAKYKVIFKPLWRIKHIELVLTAKVWKMQVCNEKLFRSMAPEMGAVTKTLNLLTAKMIHFINDIQYYILFEVIECEWVQLCASIEAAGSIDDILQSHHNFLKAIKTRIFLDESGRSLWGTLEVIYRSIMNLEAWQERFYATCERELEARNALEEAIKLSEHLGTFGITKEQQFDRDQEQKIFESQLKQCQISLKKISFSYEQCVHQFLMLLAESNDYSLQLLVTRIDYNDYYKKNDQRLQEPLTYERMRMSSMFHVIKNRQQSPARRLPH